MQKISFIKKEANKNIIKKEKIIVGLVQINNNYAGQSYLPYSIGLLQSYVLANTKNPLRYEFLVPIHLRINVEDAIEKLKNADVVGFSVYVWNVRLTLEIARRLKKLKPNVVIVFGGPQVPNHAEIFLKQHTFIDLVINGEGEIGFFELLENLENNDFNLIQSARFINKDGKYISNISAPRIVNHIDEFSPYLKDIFIPLMNENKNEKWLAIWETNRGCPFACTYCDWGSSIQSKVNKFEMDRLYKEIKWFAENRIEFVFCADANFGMLERDYEIAKNVANSKKQFGYPRTISVQNTKNATEKSYKVQKLLADNKLNTSITLSFQSTDKQTLKNIKRDNISLDSFKELQKRFTRDKIPTYTDIIIGLPGETYDSYANGVSSVIEGGQHNRIFFMNLSILPNAEMGDPEYQKKFGIKTIETEVVYIRGSINQIEDEFIELQELVIANNELTKEDWVKARAFAWLCNLLHFNKILQIPLILLNNVYRCSYREIIEEFLLNKEKDFVIIKDMAEFFKAKAKAIQNGDHEFSPSKEWLGVYWPVDEYYFIKLTTEGNINKFYDEAIKLIISFLERKNIKFDQTLIEEACLINKNILKLPNIKEDISLNVHYNIYEYYKGVTSGNEIELEKINKIYEIDRTSKKWDDFDTWCREVVWYSSKSGDYIYNIKYTVKNENNDFKLSGHH